MAITITQAVTGIYPAYNDSYIKFTTGLANPTYAEIDLTLNTVDYTFKVYPDLNGEFLFNFLDVIKAQFNVNGFKDSNSGSVLNGESISGAYDTVTFDITVYNGVDTPETLLATAYEFYKSVKQVGETVFTNEAEVLAHSTNGVDFNLTYFEGYPFTIDLKRLTSSDNLTITNLNTAVTSTTLIAFSTNAFRLNVDKATSNWTTSGFLPLMDILNRLEVKVNSIFKTNINLKKVTGIEDCDEGIYIKWFNNHGGYSYWLFDKFYTTEVQARENYEVATNDFSNVGSLVNPITSGGYDAEERLVVKSQFDVNEGYTLKDLFSSPSVQIWSQREPWKAGEWIDVKIKGSYTSSTKKSLNDITATIELPKLITPKL